MYLDTKHVSGLVWVPSPYGCINIIVLPWFHPGCVVTWEEVSNVCCRGVEYSWVAPEAVSSLIGFVTQRWLENVRLVSLKEFFLSRCGLCRSFCVLVFAELLDLLCEHHYLLFCTKHAEYFKTVFSRNLIQQQICLKGFRNHRVQVASCVPLTFDIRFFFSCGPGPMH